MKLPKYILLVGAPFFSSTCNTPLQYFCISLWRAPLKIPLFSIFVSLFDGIHLKYPSSVSLYLSLTEFTYNTPLQYFCISFWRTSLSIPRFSIFVSLWRCPFQYPSSVILYLSLYLQYFSIFLWLTSLTILLCSIFVSLFDRRQLQYPFSVFLYLSLTDVNYNTSLQ